MTSKTGTSSPCALAVARYESPHAMTRDFESSYPKQRKPATMFTDDQKADIIKRYKAGEGPTAISKSLGCSKSTIVHLISKAGVTEGRTGQHLKKKPEPQPEENEPV